MTIDKFDNLVIETLDSAYSIIQSNSSFVESISIDGKFLKFQKEVNEILLKMESKITSAKISLITKNEESQKLIKEILKKYVAIFFFLLISFKYYKTRNIFVNKFIDFSRQQNNFLFKVEDFFNGESTNYVIEKSKYLAKIFFEENKKDWDNKDTSFHSLTKAKYPASSDEITKQAILVKEFIFEENYKKIGKNQFIEIISDNDEKDEFMYIDIVVPQDDNIDASMIESTLPKKIRNIENAKIFVDLLTDSYSGELISNEEKIKRLINSKAIIPIVQDFLLFNKDSEKYVVNPANKKDTKIKYIVGKINKVKDLFDTEENDETKYFPDTMKSRRAIFVNEKEDLAILEKSAKYSSSSEDNILYKDHASYKKYPYINFNQIKSGNGFQFYPTKTVNVIRDSTINALENSQEIPKVIETRTISEGDIINIVGFFISGGLNNLNCINTKKITNIRKIDISKNEIIESSDEKNGNMKMNKLLKVINFQQVRTPIGYYWMFDLKKDQLSSSNFNLIDFTDKQLVTKLMITEFYESINFLVKKEIEEKVFELSQKYPITINKLNSIINHYEDYFFPLMQDTQFYEKVKRIVIEGTNTFVKKNIKAPPKEKRKNYKLPILVREEKDLPIKITSEKEKKKKIIIAKTEVVCQHNYDWNKLSVVRKGKNSNENFENMLYEFISKYVVASKSDSICKSCGFTIPLAEYTEGGHYSSSGSFIYDSKISYVPLYKMKKYEKYGEDFINELDFIFQRIATVFNIGYYIGDISTEIRFRRDIILKDAIDLMENDFYFLLKKKYGQRSRTLEHEYGILPSKTLLIPFELTTDIYHNVSEKKKIIQNNIIAYLIVLLLIDIDEKQIIGIKTANEKLCVTKFYKKYGFKYFEKIKIISDLSSNKKPILEFDTLCYTIFTFTCLLVKYNIWKSLDVHTPSVGGNNKKQPAEVSKNKKKFSIQDHLSATHTIIDLINNILETQKEKHIAKKNLIYKRIIEKFMYKLNSMYNSSDIVEKIDSIDENSKDEVYISSHKVDIQSAKKVESQYIPVIYQRPRTVYSTYQPLAYFSKLFIDYDIERINETTNCVDGKFHEFKTQGKDLVCTNCKMKKNIPQSLIEENYRKIIVDEISKKYEMKKDVVEKYLRTIIQEKLQKEKNNIASLSDELEKKKKTIKLISSVLEKKYEKIITSYESMKNGITDFIKGISQIMGKELKVNDEYYFTADIYLITHNYNGDLVKIPEQVKDDGVNVKKIQNHNFFKKNVIQVIVPTREKSTYFFDEDSLLFLGYKQTQSSDIKNAEKYFYCRIIRSLSNRILFLGVENKNVKNISSAIISRNDNLKKIIPEIQKQLFRIINGYFSSYKPKPEGEPLTDSDVFIIKEKKLHDKYYERFKKSKISTEDSKKKFMSKWKKIIEIDLVDDSKTIPKTGSIKEIYDNDKTGNLILSYIISNLRDLIEFNPANEKLMCSFVIDVLSENYSFYNKDDDKLNQNLIRFTSIIDNEIYVVDQTNTKLKKMKVYNDDGTITYAHGSVVGNNDEDDVFNEMEASELGKKENREIGEMLDAIDMDGSIDYSSMDD